MVWDNFSMLYVCIYFIDQQQWVPINYQVLSPTRHCHQSHLVQRTNLKHLAAPVVVAVALLATRRWNQCWHQTQWQFMLAPIKARGVAVWITKSNMTVEKLCVCIQYLLQNCSKKDEMWRLAAPACVVAKFIEKK